MILAVGLFVLLISMIPQWIVIGPDLKLFHFAGIVFVAIVATQPRCLSLIRLAVQENFVVLFGFFAFLVIALAMTGAHRFPYYTRTDLIRQLFFLGVGLAACLAVAAMDRKHLRRLCLAAGVALPVAFLAIVLVSVMQRGLSPSRLAFLFVNSPTGFVRSILLELFRSSLVGVGEGFEEAASNLRHGIMNVILLGMLLMLAFPKDASGGRVASLLKIAAALGASGLILISFSRSVTIELGLCVMLAAGLLTLVRGINPWLVIAGCLGVLVVGALATSQLGEALATRFTEETGSYEARGEAIGASLEALRVGFWIGTDWRPDITGEPSPHNMILSAGRGTGVFGMLAMAAFVLAYVVGGVVLAFRAIRKGTLDYGGADVRWVIGLAIVPAIRSMTAGNGMAIAEWVALGAFMGFRVRAALAPLAAPAKDEARRPAEWRSTPRAGAVAAALPIAQRPMVAARFASAAGNAVVNRS